MMKWILELTNILQKGTVHDPYIEQARLEKHCTITITRSMPHIYVAI